MEPKPKTAFFARTTENRNWGFLELSEYSFAVRRLCLYSVKLHLKDGRKNTHNNNVHRDRRHRSVSTSSTVSRHKRTDEWTDRCRESNLVHFSLKIWHLVAIILTSFLIINWPNFVYLLVDPDFIPPKFLWSIAVCSPHRMHTRQTQRTKRQTNKETRPSVSWSLTQCLLKNARCFADLLHIYRSIQQQCCFRLQLATCLLYQLSVASTESEVTVLHRRYAGISASIVSACSEHD